jgi:CRISPR-associated protein Csb3
MMASASIPVNLRNAGQVFASFGFFEIADTLLGDAQARFDWSDRSNVRFCLRARGDHNPFAAVLQFLAKADIHSYAPIDSGRAPGADILDDTPDGDRVETSEEFPARAGDRMALPIRLEAGGHVVHVTHWADGSREPFKLYAGNRSAFSIASDMLHGKRDKPRKKQLEGELRTKGVASLWTDDIDALIARPFDVLTPMGGSFNFDARGGWTAIDAGYSPNEHADQVIDASPIVEILAACGLEHARPHVERRRVRYGVWAEFAPPTLARAVLGGAELPLDVRIFRFTLGLAGKNKVVTFSQEESSHGADDDRDR